MADKLQALTYPQEVAVIEASERWWREPAADAKT